MTVKYDPSVIQTFADSLYIKANTIVVVYTFYGLLVGGVIGIFGGAIGAIFGSVVCGLIGMDLGRGKAFSLRLQAQIVLCQVQIEKHGRKITQKSEQV